MLQSRNAGSYGNGMNTVESRNERGSLPVSGCALDKPQVKARSGEGGKEGGVKLVEFD